ncbi:MAG: DnaA ATPase domain-containing protein [Candidatus Humimicrobiaceae bacterium]
MTPNSIPECEFCGKEYKSDSSRWLYYEPDCDCAHKKYVKECQLLTGKNKIDRIRNIKINSGIGQRFYHKTFLNYSGNKAKKDCMEWAKNYRENIKLGKGLFLTGTVGTGKTHLLSAIIDYIARVKKSLNFNDIIYRTTPAMLNEIRNSYENKDFEDVINKFKDCHLLIIDDLGAEKTTDWVLDIFFEIIDSRYADLRPVIIASNLTAIEIKQKLDERIMSRIYEMSMGIKLTGSDWRLEGK